MNDTGSAVRYAVLTPDESGAVAIVQVWGTGAAGLIEKLTGRPPSETRTRLSDLGGVDEGVIAPLGAGVYQIMPHGGRGVMAEIRRCLGQLGAEEAASPDPLEIYPEASTVLEAWMLATMARAASPAALDLLLRQPEVWSGWLRTRFCSEQQVLEQSRRLQNLLHPPRLVLVGAPNVGKSTLTNRMAGRAVSLEENRPGTTRDWVGVELLLDSPIGQIRVEWRDTPGRRRTSDPVESRALAISDGVISAADLLILVRDPGQDWPQVESGWPVRRLRILNKSDLACGPLPPDCQVAVSARTGEGFANLHRAIVGALELEAVDPQVPWAFCPPLEKALREYDPGSLAAWLEPVAGWGSGG